MDNKVLLHRISHHGNISRPLLREYNYLTIGFSDFLSVDNFVENTIKEGKDYLDRTTKELWGEKKRNRNNLFRFIKMKKGDWVLIPSSGKFSIYEIIDKKTSEISTIEPYLNRRKLKEKNLKIKNNKLYKSLNNDIEKLIDLGFVREVKPIQTGISRKKYADSALTKRMKIRQTNADISDLNENINEAIKAFKEKRTINLHSQITEATTRNTLEIIKQKLNPDKFENLIKWYFQRCGATNVEIPPKNEKDKVGDVDIAATFEHLKTIIYVQAKFHEGKTGKLGLDQVKDYVDNIAQQDRDEEYSKIKWLITTANDFTDNCKDELIDKNITSISGEEFTQMILEVGISNLENI